jgi:PBP1b-binding outer membrane lipoprotein LpoB
MEDIMKYMVFLITILLTGCMDSLEYVQLENKSNYNIYIHEDDGAFIKVAPNSKLDVKLNDLFTDKVKGDGFMISIVDKEVEYNYYFNLNNKEFRNKYIKASFFNKDRYFFRYKMNKLYLFSPKEQTYKQVQL